MKPDETAVLAGLIFDGVSEVRYFTLYHELLVLHCVFCQQINCKEHKISLTQTIIVIINASSRISSST